MSERHFVPPGRYRHYKGKEYTVIGTARHSESLEELVVYRQEYGERGLWVRPKSMFAESVEIDGTSAPRFRPISANDPAPSELPQNVFADVPTNLPAEIMQTLLQAGDVRVERIVSHGHSSPLDFWYDQAQHEWVLVLQGAARLQFEDRFLELQSGDFVNIPAGAKHRVDWTTPDRPTIWLAVWYSQSP